MDAPGILVFSGLPSGTYLHSMRPDGGSLRSVALPKTCSPETYTRDGRVLVCFDLSDEADLDRFEYAVEREGGRWLRVPMPADLRFPEWANWLERDVDAPEWAPGGDRLALITEPADDALPWFSATGKVTVADPDGSEERVLAEDGQAPAWSPDGKRIAFARCRVYEPDREEDAFADERADCSLWTVPADGKEAPEVLVKDAASVPFWSPDGRFVAFLRKSGSCERFCRYRIYVVPAGGGDPEQVGPELVEPSEGWWPGTWRGLSWLPDSAFTVVAAAQEETRDTLHLQLCVDIWNRARMHPWPTGAVNVSVVNEHCQLTVRDYRGVCTQSTPEMRFRFWCPSHGAQLRELPPEQRVWNAHGGQDGQLSLFDPPEGPRLPLPKAPPHPLLDGYVVPFGKDGEPLPDLKLTETTGTCERPGDLYGHPLGYPDRYPLRCSWEGSGSDNCFKQTRRLEIGDGVLCPDSRSEEAYDPMRFFRVKVSGFW
jgi:WD40-like Beta Propeller Repeat